jgi:hypothetical protein
MLQLHHRLPALPSGALKQQGSLKPMQTLVPLTATTLLHLRTEMLLLLLWA